MRPPVPSLEVVYRSFISASEAWTSFSLLSSSARYLGKKQAKSVLVFTRKSFHCKICAGRALWQTSLQRRFCCYVVRPPPGRFQPCARAEIETQTWPFPLQWNLSCTPQKTAKKMDLNPNAETRAGATEASPQLPNVGHSTGISHSHRLNCLQTQSSFVKIINHTLQWTGTLPGKLLQRQRSSICVQKNIQDLETDISEAAAVVRGASSFAFCSRTKLLTRSVLRNDLKHNVIRSAGNALHVSGMARNHNSCLLTHQY